jgi:hypothetical protein
MRCSITSHFITAGGPLFNILAAVLLGALLYRGTRSPTIDYLVWLACAFNALVACGYPMVGGATDFGDWAVLLGAIKPAWVWRALALSGGLVAYLASLRALSYLYRRANPGAAGKALLRRRLLVPGVAAALIACAAEFATGQRNPWGFLLPLAGTIVPALTLFSIAADYEPQTLPEEAVLLPFSGVLLALALLIGAFFVGVVGLKAGLLV